MLAREKEESVPNTPMHLAALFNKIDVLRVLLEHDRSLGYALGSTSGDTPLLVSAAHRGHVDVARELLKHCPDAPYCYTSGWTCLHEAVSNVHKEFVEFVLGSPQLRRLIKVLFFCSSNSCSSASAECDDQGPACRVPEVAADPSAALVGFSSVTSACLCCPDFAGHHAHL